MPPCAWKPLETAYLKASGHLQTLRRFPQNLWRKGWDSNPRCVAASLVFKTSSLNHSDISPYCRLSYATIYFIPFFQPFVKIFLNFFQTFSKFCKFILFPPPHALKKHSRSNSVCTNYARQKVRLSVCNPLFS